MNTELDTKVKSVPAVEYLGDPADPNSLYSSLTKRIISAAMTIKPEHIKMTDKELMDLVPRVNRTDLSRLRKAFWLAVHHASGTSKKILETHCYKGVMSHSLFYWNLEHPERVALILRPPVSYDIMIQEALDYSVEQIRDILSQDHISPKTGLLDAKIADVKRRIFENLADRVKGMPVQRTENLNVNKELGPGQDFEDALPTDSKDIDKKIAELNKDMGIDKEKERDVTTDD